MQFEFAIAYRQNITDYSPVQYALKNAISNSIGVSLMNVVIAGSKQNSLCAVPIRKTSDTLPFLRFLTNRGTTMEKISETEEADWYNPFIRFQAAKSKKSTVSFAIFSGMKGTNTEELCAWRVKYFFKFLFVSRSISSCLCYYSTEH